MKIQIQKWGNSLGLRIPKLIAKETRLEENSIAELSIKAGKIVIMPAQRKAVTLKQLLKKITPRNLHREVPTGPAKGKEIW